MGIEGISGVHGIIDRIISILGLEVLCLIRVDQDDGDYFWPLDAEGNNPEEGD